MVLFFLCLFFYRAQLRLNLVLLANSTRIVANKDGNR